MTDDYKKGLVTGLAMQPLYVVNSMKQHTGGGMQVAEGIYAELMPLKLIFAKETTTE